MFLILAQFYWFQQNICDMKIQLETVCAKNIELANILRSPWVFTIHEAEGL